MFRCGARRSSLPAVPLAAVVVVLLIYSSAPAAAQPHRRQQKQQRRQQGQQLPGRTSTPCVVCLLSARPSATPATPYSGFNARLNGAPQPLGFAINATAVAAATASAAASASGTSGRGPGARASTGGGPRGPGFVYVPRSYDPRRPSPLAVMLHGAGGRADPLSGNWSFGGAREVEDSRLIIVVPESAGRTWDAVRGGAFGPDVVALDAALAAVFAAFSVDASRVALAGHSDGASYALSLGLANPQLFTHLVAFSPGFMRPPPAAAAWLDAAVAAAGRAAASSAKSSSSRSSSRSSSSSSSNRRKALTTRELFKEATGEGTGAPAAAVAAASERQLQALEPQPQAQGGGRGRLPRVFVAHGQEDEILPVRCSHRIVSRLRAAGLEVEYLEFHGLHVLTQDIAAAGLRFLLKD